MLGIFENQSAAWPKHGDEATGFLGRLFCLRGAVKKKKKKGNRTQRGFPPVQTHVNFEEQKDREQEADVSEEAVMKLVTIKAVHR